MTTETTGQTTAGASTPEPTSPQGAPLSFERIRASFRPDTAYLNTATYGLPSDDVVTAMTSALDRWQRGIATPEEYDGGVDRSRELFAALVGVAPEHVAVANQVSVLVGTVAASLPDGCNIVAVENDFASLLFPLYAQEHRGVTVRTVPLEGLADAIDERTGLVASSLVQSSDGRVADLEAVLEATDRVGARTLIDGTQSVGWLPLDASRVDYLVVGAYKWLLSPRGTAFMAVRPERAEDLRPVAPGWYAGEDVWGSIYGPAMQLAGSARRADVSPAWLCWMGTVPALELIAQVGVDRIHRHDVELADAIREGLSLPASTSAIVAIPLAQPVDLSGQNITASMRAGSLRVGCHLYNDLTDVEALLTAIGPAVRQGG